MLPHQDRVEAANGGTALLHEGFQNWKSWRDGQVPSNSVKCFIGMQRLHKPPVQEGHKIQPLSIQPSFEIYKRN